MVSYRPPDRKLKLKNITVLSSVCMSNYMRKLWERNGRFHKYIASQGHLTHTYVGGFSVYYTASTCKLSKTHTNKHMYSVYIHVLYVCHRRMKYKFCKFVTYCVVPCSGIAVYRSPKKSGHMFLEL